MAPSLDNAERVHRNVNSKVKCVFVCVGFVSLDAYSSVAVRSKCTPRIHTYIVVYTYVKLKTVQWTRAHQGTLFPFGERIILAPRTHMDNQRAQNTMDMVMHKCCMTGNDYDAAPTPTPTQLV